MLCLRCNLALGGFRIPATPEHNEHLGRTGRKIDCDVARHEQLRLVHVGIAGPDDLVDRRDRVRAVRQSRDRLWPADRPHLVHAEQLRRSRDETRAGGWRDDDDPVHACNLSGHRAHDDVETSP
jgi:hypothetical protein